MASGSPLKKVRTNTEGRSRLFSIAVEREKNGQIFLSRGGDIPFRYLVSMSRTAGDDLVAEAKAVFQLVNARFIPRGMQRLSERWLFFLFHFFSDSVGHVPELLYGGSQLIFCETKLLWPPIEFPWLIDIDALAVFGTMLFEIVGHVTLHLKLLLEHSYHNSCGVEWTASVYDVVARMKKRPPSFHPQRKKIRQSCVA
jgi:hypothetical protein